MIFWEGQSLANSVQEKNEGLFYFPNKLTIHVFTNRTGRGRLRLNPLNHPSSHPQLCHPLLVPPQVPLLWTPFCPRRQFRPLASCVAWPKPSLSLKILIRKMGTIEVSASMVLARIQQDLGGVPGAQEGLNRCKLTLFLNVFQCLLFFNAGV